MKTLKQLFNKHFKISKKEQHLCPNQWDEHIKIVKEFLIQNQQENQKNTLHDWLTRNEIDAEYKKILGELQ